MNISKENAQDPVKAGHLITEMLIEKYPHLYATDSKDIKLNKANEVKISPELPAGPDEIKNISPEDNIENDSLADIEPDNSSVVHNIDHGAFELNFAEFPIAHLTQRLPKGIDKHKIEYSDLIKGKNGELIPRHWTIRTTADHGLGGPTSVDVLFELMQIWKEQGFEKDKIFIGTYHNLLKRLGLDTGGKTYDQLEKDLKSIYGLDIEAKNAYYDKVLGEYVDKSVKPFIGYQFNRKNETKDYFNDYGYIQVNPEFFKDFKKKSLYYLPFDNEYFKSLTAHEQKLSLYLTKVFNPYRKKIQNVYTRNIESLCNLLPLYGTSRKKKYYLVQACKGLIDKNFILLERFAVEDDKIIFYNRQQQSLLPYLNAQSNFKPIKQIEFLIEEQIKLCKDIHSTKFYTLVAKFVPDELIYQCLSEAKQEGKDPKKLFTKLIIERAKTHIEQYLKSPKSDLDNNESPLNTELKISEEEKHELHKFILNSY